MNPGPTQPNQPTPNFKEDHQILHCAKTNCKCDHLAENIIFIEHDKSTKSKWQYMLVSSNILGYQIIVTC